MLSPNSVENRHVKKPKYLTTNVSSTVESSHVVYSNELKITGRQLPKHYEKLNLLHENRPLINNQQTRLLHLFTSELLTIIITQIR